MHKSIFSTLIDIVRAADTYKFNCTRYTLILLGVVSNWDWDAWSIKQNEEAQRLKSAERWWCGKKVATMLFSKHRQAQHRVPKRFAQQRWPLLGRLLDDDRNWDHGNYGKQTKQLVWKKTEWDTQSFSCYFSETTTFEQFKTISEQSRRVSRWESHQNFRLECSTEA